MFPRHGKHVKLARGRSETFWLSIDEYVSTKVRNVDIDTSHEGARAIKCKLNQFQLGPWYLATIENGAQ
ncbi:MAG: hypothetical protein IPM54_13400 [Polyangiaceae bacterium]|nr:hypothetical protein [Polyangiaceae bacterium]